ncbi:hypothetical protein AVEN_104847-1 [Araneus ventricosus]|uniref:Uncharacterized protein n=1 Tax=Araneus ventricosus TaxID=182803 RepID=A0A4Y2N9Y2_ARAVE|nr:hypothetical protein AVEN_104847-1 [Araneus ventricosus]
MQEVLLTEPRQVPEENLLVDSKEPATTVDDLLGLQNEMDKLKEGINQMDTSIAAAAAFNTEVPLPEPDPFDTSFVLGPKRIAISRRYSTILLRYLHDFVRHSEYRTALRRHSTISYANRDDIIPEISFSLKLKQPSKLKSRFEATRGQGWYELHHFEPWSDDEGDI